MRILIVEDDLISRMVMTGNLSKVGRCDVASDGVEAVQAVQIALDEKEHFDLICLDIMMPNMDGQEALKHIRDLETQHGILPGEGTKIIMTTALSTIKNISEAYKGECDAYLVKPVKPAELMEKLREMDLI